MDSSPPPNTSRRRFLLLLLLIVAGGVAAPVLVSTHHQRKLRENERLVLKALRAFAVAQDARIADGKEAAGSFKDLGGAWAEIAPMDAPDPTDFHGYRFRVLARGGVAGGYALLAAPSRYGFTGRHSFLLAGPPLTVHAIDWGVKTDSVVRALTDYNIPPGAIRVEAAAE